MTQRLYLPSHPFSNKLSQDKLSNTLARQFYIQKCSLYNITSSASICLVDFEKKKSKFHAQLLSKVPLYARPMNSFCRKKLVANSSPPCSAASIQCTATHISPGSFRTSLSFPPDPELSAPELLPVLFLVLPLVAFVPPVPCPLELLRPFSFRLYLSITTCLNTSRGFDSGNVVRSTNSGFDR